MTTFYGYHEANPFSTARNQTGTRDRHLFGEASSVDSKESMMDKAATVVVPPTIGGGVAGAKAPAAGATTTTTTTSSTTGATETKTKDVASTSTATATTQESTTSSDQTSTSTVTASKDSKKGDSTEKAVQALAIVEEEKGISGNKKSSNDGVASELANGRVDEETGSISNGPENNSNGQENGVNMRRGQQHHRHRTFSKYSEENTSSATSVSGATATTAPAPTAVAAASSPTASDQASSIPSYSLRSRSGSRSHHLLASTPDSPPVRGMIHIAGDSELLNNRDFSFSYEPSELLEQRGPHHHHHQYGQNPFDGMMEEDEGGFGTSATSSNGRRRPSLSNHRTATGGSSSAASSLGRSGGHQPMRSQSGGHVASGVAGTGHLLHGLRHISSDGQLSHSSSSNLSSLGSTHSYSAGSLHHRRSTGRIKTSSSGDHYLAGHNNHTEDGMSSEAMGLGTSLDDPTSSSFMSWRKASSAGLLGLGGATTEAFGGRGGFEDGMPAFFADDVDDSLDQADNISVAGSVSTFAGGVRRSGITVGRSGSRPESGSDQDTTGQGQGPDSNDADSSIIQMADGSSKNVSSTHVHEITV